jgi:hypothetical protein
LRRPDQLPTKFASKPVSAEFMQGLEVLENKVYPLQGATVKGQSRDPRLAFQVATGLGTGTGTVCYYEHVATIRHVPTQTFFIVFRQTKDAQLLEQSDPVKYPKWLMEHAVKNAELTVYIHMAMPNAPAILKSGVSSIDEWLDPIPNELTFNSIAKFCLTKGIFTEQMYGSIR